MSARASDKKPRVALTIRTIHKPEPQDKGSIDSTSLMSSN